MDVALIGKNIAVLRKTRGVKQEELARFVGVSAQAVSKWENGGVPDTELLPKIAEFFQVSIDELFGIQIGVVANIQDAILEDITKTKAADRIARAFELCWMIEQSMYGTIISDSERFKEEARAHSENDQLYSQVLMDSGYTEMGLFNRMQYFLVVPDAMDKDKALFEGIDYPSLFKLLSDRDIFNSLVFLYQRESKHLFTEQLLTTEMNLTQQKAKEVMGELLRFGVVEMQMAEVEGVTMPLYHFWSRPSFVSMLIFAREMIDIPSNFYVNNGGRRKPFLK